MGEPELVSVGKLDNALKQRVGQLLQKFGLIMEDDLEYTAVLIEDGEIVATGSYSGPVLKCIAVSPDRRNSGYAVKIVSHLIGESYFKGRYQLFVYTKPENLEIFEYMGFTRIASIPGKVVLLERGINNIKSHVAELHERFRFPGDSAAVVVNCNPFTKGHRYLIQTAAASTDRLHVFVVSEDRSLFPESIRYRLVYEGTKDIKNVVVHRGGPYIISAATFPTYFLRREGEAAEVQARLDVTIFADYFVPALNLKARYVGEEPYCPFTRLYNDIMREVLTRAGVEVRIIPRYEVKGRAVSASMVRDLIRRGEWEQINELVPETTMKYLLSRDAKPVLEKIKNTDTPH